MLKKAKMTKKGRSNSNLAIGCMVETLVVLSTDLVQVVAKAWSFFSKSFEVVKYVLLVR